MLDFLWQLIIAAAIGFAFFAVGNLYLAVISNANPQAIRVTTQLRKLARKVPKTAVFSSRNRVVTGVVYDSGRDAEIEFYRGQFGLPFIWLVPWSGSNRPGKMVARRATADLVFRYTLLASVVIPSLALVIWLGITKHWTWFLLLAVLLAHQVTTWVVHRSIFIKSAPFTTFALLVLLQRTSVLPISWTWCVVLLAAWCIASFVVMWWVEKDG